MNVIRSLLLMTSLILGLTPAAQATSCSPGGGTSIIGLEFVVDSCPPYEDDATNHYIVNAINCSGGKVTRYAHYGDQLASPQSLANAGASQNYRVLWNKDNSHIVYVHRYFNGTIDGKSLGSYPTGNVSTNGFDEVFFPNGFPDTDNNLNPDCVDNSTTTTTSDPVPITDPCSPGNVAVNSNVHIASGNLSLRQPLFSETETGIPNGLNLIWGSLGSGWQLNATVHYEKTWAPKAGVSYSYVSNSGYQAVLRDDDDNNDGRVYPIRWIYPKATIPTLDDAPYIKLQQGTGNTLYFSEAIEGSVNLTTPNGPMATWSPTTNSISYPDGTLLTFNTAGKLLNHSNRNGLVIQYNYLDEQLTSIVDKHGRTTLFNYDSQGQLISVTAPDGRTITASYSDGRMSQLLSSDGRAHTFSYTTTGQLSSITDPAGNIKSYAYDNNGQLIAGTSPDGTRTISYDTSNHRTIITNRDGSTTTHSYDPQLSTPTEVIDAQGGIRTSSYNSRLQLTASSDQEGREQSYSYDTAGNLISSTDASGATTNYSYNSFGDPTSTTDPLGNTTQISYDDQGNAITITLANGLQILNSYNSLGQLVSQQQINGATTSYSYDTNGFLSQVTAADGNSTHYQHDISGRLLQVTDAAGNATHYSYDTAGRMVQSSNALGETTSYSYNDLDQLIQTTDPEGQVTQLSYDHAGRLLTLTQADGSQTSYQYNSLGQAVTNTDANLHTTQFDLNFMDQITRTTDPLGHITELAYQNDGLSLTQLTDARGNTINYNYDNGGRIISSDTQGVLTHYSYNENGQIIRRIDARGVICEYSYDSLGRLTQAHYPTNTHEDILYGYDDGLWGGGQLTSMQDTSGLSRYSYDKRGRLISKNQTLQGIDYQTFYHYDNLGNLIGLDYPGGLSVTTNYDALNRPVTINASYNGQSWDVLQNVTYHSSGQPLQIVHGNGLISQASYGPTNQLQHLSLGNQLQQQFSYDAAGQLTGILQTLPKNQDSNYAYDAVNRLTTADQGIDNWLYQYDAVGNRLTKNSNDVIDNYTYAASSNQLQATTGSGGSTPQSYSYDAHGNTIAIGSMQLNYNQANRLSSIDNNGDSTLYLYNGNNLRVVKQGSTDTTHYHYDNQGHLIAETDDSGTLLQAIIWYGQQPAALLDIPTQAVSQPDHLRTFVAASVDNPEQNHRVTIDTQHHTIRVEGSAHDGLYTIPDSRWHVENGRTRFSWREGSLKIAGSILTDKRVDGRFRFVYFDGNNTITSKQRFKLWDGNATVSENSAEQLSFSAVNVNTTEQLDVQLDQTSHTLTIASGPYAGNYAITDRRWKVEEDRTRFSHVYNDTTVIRGHIMHTGYHDGMLRVVETVDGVKSKQIYRLWNLAGSDMQPAQPQVPTLYQVHCNPIGAPVLLTNDTGTVIWSAEYSPFGNAEVNYDADGNGQSITFNLRFPGQYFDLESGLHYNWHRYYDPETGRYLTTDPIGLAGGDVNLYGYVGNNPLVYVDPAGLIKWVAVGEGSLAVLGGGMAVVGGAIACSTGIGATGGVPAVLIGSAGVGWGISQITIGFLDNQLPFMGGKEAIIKGTTNPGLLQNELLGINTLGDMLLTGRTAPSRIGNIDSVLQSSVSISKSGHTIINSLNNTPCNPDPCKQ